MSGASQEYLDYMLSLQEDVENGLLDIRQSAEEMQKAVASMRQSLDDFKLDEQQRTIRESARQSALTQKSNEEMDDDSGDEFDIINQMHKHGEN